ncbi:MAG: sigma-70 family RNA polymerase sigma factor [Ruminococcaceae bacterium]|nr:sigma-70 family RNA polymerase sigma factor [Oscillospiraceae bacterium]
MTETDKYSQNAELVLRAQEGDTEAEEELVELNIGLVRSIAQRFCGRGTELEDLIQIGTIGLVKAVRSFDAERGFAFSTYAVPMIMGEIRRTLRDDGLIKVGRAQKKLGAELLAARTRIMNEEGREPGIIELSKICGITSEEAAMAIDAVTPVSSLSETVGEGEGMSLESRIADPDNEIERVRDRVALAQAIGKLPQMRKKIVLLRYFRELTQAETARELGLSQVKISREEKKIVEFLRSELI